MDACDPGVNVRNLKRLVKQNTGLELNLTREQICDAYSSIQDGKLPLPPMVLSKDGKYMLDRKSPLTGNDFEILFGSDSTVAQLKRVARKAGLASYKDMTKSEMVEAIESILESKNIREPIRLHVSAQRATRKVSVNNNNNYPNNLNVNNVNGNGVPNKIRKNNNNNNNLAKIANESKNLNRNGETRNGNRNGETRNGNRNGETRNGNRNVSRNGNRNARPPVNRTTARYVNAMLRRPSNSRRNEDLAKVLAAARTTGNGSTQNLSRVIEAIRKKPNTDGSTAATLNKLLRAKTSGNSDALRRAMKEIEILTRRGPVVPVAPVTRVNNKQQKITELEKYAVNRASRLGNQRLQFMNEAQKYVNGYKNGKFNSISAKARITARYEEIYKKQVKEVGFNKGVLKLQEKTKSIQNTKIKSEAMERLEEYKKTGSQSVMNDIIQLEKLDKQLGNRQKKVDDLFNKNRRYLNATRDEVLKTKPYNLKNGLAKLDKIIEEKEKEIEEKKRKDNINNLIKNAKYEKLTQNKKNEARKAYMNGGSTLKEVRSALNKLVAENKNKDNINKLLFNNPKYRKFDLNTKNKIKEAYLSGKYTLDQVKQVLNKLVANNTGNNNQPPLSLNRIFKGNFNTLPTLTNANRKKLNKEKNNNIKTKLNNTKTKLNSMSKARNAVVNKLKNRNATIKSLKEELTKGGVSNKERQNLKEQIRLLEAGAVKSGHELETRNATIAKLREELTKGGLSKEERQKLQGQIETLTSAVEAFNKNVKERNATIKSLENQLKSGELSNKERQNLKGEIANLKGAALVSEEELETLRKKQTEFKKQLNQSATELAAARAAQSAANKSKEIAIKEAEQAAVIREKEILNSTSVKIQEAQKEAKAAQNKANEANASVKAATVEMNMLRAETNGKVTAAEEKVAKLQRQLNERLPANEANKLKKQIKNAKNAANVIKTEAAENLAKAQRNIKAEKNRAIAAEEASRKAAENIKKTEKAAALARQEQQKAKERINTITKEFENYRATSNKVTQEREEKFKLLTTELKERNAKLSETLGNVERLKKNLASSNASSAKKNQILQKLESEKKNLKRQWNMAEGGRIALTKQISDMKRQRNMAEGGRIALENKLKKLQAEKTISNKQRNAFRQKLRTVAKRTGGLRVNLAATQKNLHKTATNLNHARLQMKGRINGMNQGQKRIQAQLKQARQSAQNYKAAARRNVGPQFNATGAFQNMGNKLAANRNAWKRAGGRWQGAQSGVKAQENLRVAKNALRTIINSHRKDGNWTIGGPVGWKRQTLRHKVNTATNMNQIKEARRLVAAAKKEKNFKIGRGKMDPVLAKAGTGFSFGNRGPPMTMNQRFA